MIESVKYLKGCFYFLDQTLLPETEQYFKVHGYRHVIDAIKKLQVRGAPLLGIAAAIGVYCACRQYAKDKDAVKIALTEIAQTRPTAVNLHHAINYLQENSERLTADFCLRYCFELMEQEKIASFLLAQNALIYLPQRENYTIITHCNTGSLATYGEGTALSVIKALAKQAKVTVLVDETRPLLQGARLTVWELLKEEINCRLITDSMAASFLPQADFVITGADRICQNGDAANKIGTLSLAIAAKYYQRPFYIAAPETTLDMHLKTGAEITIEQRAPEEVTTLKGMQLTCNGTQVYNPAFDVTPAELISAIFTDKNTYVPPYLFKG